MMMKLLSIAALVLAATTTQASANFAVYEGIFEYTNDSTDPPTIAEKLFMESCLLSAANEANPGADFTAQAVETDAPQIVARRGLRKDGEKRKLGYGSTDWTAGSRYGGGCSFCIPGRRHLLLSSLPAVSTLACNNLANGPYAKFHSISNCQLGLVLVEPTEP